MNFATKGSVSPCHAPATRSARLRMLSARSGMASSDGEVGLALRMSFLWVAPEVLSIVLICRAGASGQLFGFFGSKRSARHDGLIVVARNYRDRDLHWHRVR